jgi:hypothetical protein
MLQTSQREREREESFTWKPRWMTLAARRRWKGYKKSQKLFALVYNAAALRERDREREREREALKAVFHPKVSLFSFLALAAMSNGTTWEEEEEKTTYGGLENKEWGIDISWYLGCNIRNVKENFLSVVKFISIFDCISCIIYSRWNTVKFIKKRHACVYSFKCCPWPSGKSEKIW